MSMRRMMLAGDQDGVGWWRLVGIKTSGTFQVWSFTETSRSSTKRASIFKHVFLTRIYCPIMAFAWPSQGFWQFNEALIQTQIMPHRIFPTLELDVSVDSIKCKQKHGTYLIRTSKKGEFLLQVLIDFVESQLFGWYRLDGHNDKRNVTVRRLFLPPNS